jgi:hypothetical protein
MGRPYNRGIGPNVRRRSVTGVTRPCPVDSAKGVHFLGEGCLAMGRVGVLAIGVGLAVWWTAFILVPPGVLSIAVGITKLVRSRTAASQRSN